MYYIIDGIYVKTGSLSYLSLFLLLYIYQAGKKKMLGIFDLTKPVQILRHKNWELNIRVIKSEGYGQN